MGGLTMWVDSTADKEKNFGVRYFGDIPKPEDKSAKTQEVSRFATGERSSAGPGKRPSLDQIVVVQGKAKSETVVPSDGSEGPAAELVCQQTLHTYEFSVPLSGNSEAAYAVGATPGQAICIGLECGVGADDFQEMHSERSGEGRGGDGGPGGMTGRPRGGGGRGGMSGGPGRGGPGSSGGPQLPEKHEAWIITTLAVSTPDTEISE
jgi:hypothetical protein